MPDNQKVENKMAKLQVQSLQVFRGFAAFSVVAHHAALSTNGFVGALPDPFATIFVMGHLGVDFFFVLSGFIIMYVHMNDNHTTAALQRYTFKRLSRIYPVYLPVGIAMLMLYAVIPDLSASGGRRYSLLSSLLLVPADGPPALSVAWTLVHELMFYLVFVLFFISRRWLAGGLLAWAILILLANQWYTPTGWLRYPLSIMNIEFILGVGAAWTIRFQIPYKKGGWIAALGIVIAVWVLLLMTRENEPYLRLILTMGFALVIVGFAIFEQSNCLRWPTLLLTLGNASFSIYLVHGPLLSITQRIAGRMQLSWSIAMVFGVVLSLLAGWFYYLSVERTALRFFQQRLRR